MELVSLSVHGGRSEPRGVYKAEVWPDMSRGVTGNEHILEFSGDDNSGPVCVPMDAFSGRGVVPCLSKLRSS
jgi:hypothetical protein